MCEAIISTDNKDDKDLDVRACVSKLLARWAEIEAGANLLTEIPSNITVKFRHPTIICVKALEQRRLDPSYDVLKVHGRSNLHTFFRELNLDQDL